LTGLAIAVLAAVAGLHSPALAETWTDNTGTHQVEADFLALRGTVVYLKKDNGVTIAVPLARLNTASQQLARQLAAATAQTATPDAAVRELLANLEAGNLRAMWDALPTSYQTDVNDVLHTFAENMDVDIWNAGKRILGKAVSVLKDKKQFILGYPALQQPGVDLSAAEKNWDNVVGLLDAIVSSELTDLDKLKTLDMAAFLDGTGKDIGAKLAALAKAVEQDVDPAALPMPPDFPGAEVVQLGDLENLKISTVSVDGDSAVIRIEKATGDSEDHEAVRVEGKWLPKEMVDGWSEGMAGAKQFLTTDMPKQLQENKQMLLSPLSPVKMAEGVLDQMLAAQDQEAFNEVINGIMEMVQGMMGGEQGPGAGPGGGADPFGTPPGGAGGGADPFAPPPGGNSGGNVDPFGGNSGAADPFGS